MALRVVQSPGCRRLYTDTELGLGKDEIMIAAAALALEMESTLSVATHLHTVCLALIERYSPAAPDEVKSEALIRMASYLDSSRDGLAVRDLKVTDTLTFEFRGAGSALRLSGSSALLSPWRPRTVGRCEAAK